MPVLLRASENDTEKNSCNQSSSLGSAAADAARTCGGTDIAVLNGGDFALNLQPGEITWDQLTQSFSEDRPLATVTISEQELYDLLEVGVSHAVLDEGMKLDRKASCFEGFPQISGFSLTYDMSAPVGERIYSVTLEDGTKVERGGTGMLTLCASEYMLSGGFGYPDFSKNSQALGRSGAQALADFIASGGLEEHDYSKEIRITVIGCGDYNLISSSPMSVVVILAILVLATTGVQVGRRTLFRRK